MFTIQRIYRAVAQQFRSFDDTAEMNEHIRLHTFAAGRKLHKNARAVLDVLTRHSCAIAGVSWLNTDTIAKMLDVCERTVRNVLKRLEALGIGQRKTVEVSGKELHFFVLNRFEIPDIFPEVSDNLSTVESAVGPIVPTVKPVSSDARNHKPKEIHKKIDDDKRGISIDQQFMEIANEEGFSEGDREKVLARIHKFAESIGNKAAYIRSAVRKAIAGKRLKQRIRSARPPGNLATSQTVSVPTSELSFESAVQAQLSRGKSDRRRDKIPESILAQQAKQPVSERTAGAEETYEETLLHIQRLLQQSEVNKVERVNC